MSHDVRAVANQMFALAANADVQLSGGTCSRLTFLAHAWHLTSFDEALCEQPVLAGAFGPVFWDLLVDRPSDHDVDAYELFRNASGQIWCSIFSTRELCSMQSVLQRYIGGSRLDLLMILHDANATWECNVNLYDVVSHDQIKNFCRKYTHAASHDMEIWAHDHYNALTGRPQHE